MFSYDFSEIFKNIFYTEHLYVTASETRKKEYKTQTCFKIS